MGIINVEEQKRHQQMLVEHSTLNGILTDLHSIADLAPRVHLSNEIGTTKTDVEFPKDLSMKLAKEAVRIIKLRMEEIEDVIWPKEHKRCQGEDVCEDGRFDLVKFFKDRLVNVTNINTSQLEMDAIDSILFRFWQLGWLRVLFQHELEKDANDLALEMQKDLMTNKYGNILAGQIGIYTNPVAMDALGTVMNELYNLGWLDILEQHQPKNEKANEKKHKAD